MKKATLLFASLMVCMIATAQTFMPCLHDLGVHQMEAQFPGYKTAVDETFNTIQNSVSPRINDIYTIPVVVHVVWKQNEENIPMSDIENQIAELNRCYRRQNPDTSNMRPIFSDVAGDPGIEFELVDVVRVQTTAEFAPTFSLTSPGMPDEVKQSAEGGSDAFDTNHFLNIWVCKIGPLSILPGQGSPVLGYAYPPAGLANWPAGAEAPSKELEGVVVDYRTFGTGKTYVTPEIGSLPMEGRTSVHEVGHYLGLRHISGDGLSGLLGIADCDADDGLNDTPTQGFQTQFVCDPTQNSCTEPVDDRPDMIENYMDYSLETCHNTFTKGQIAIMRGVLEGPRSGLLSGPSSTKNLALENAVEVFPNPFNDEVNIRVSNDEKLVRYQLTDLLGKTVRTGNLNETTLNFSFLTKGVYNLIVRTENGVVTERIIKQ